MLVNNNYSRLANTVRILNDPTMPWGTLAEEIPTDIGRSYAGYKRGGVLEGLEKLRKELMTAAVWMFGMPAFNKLGNIFCEKVLKIPTKDIDFSDAIRGNDALGDTAKYLTSGGLIKKEGLNYDELKHFLSDTKLMEKIKGTSWQDLAKKMSNAKKATSVLALGLNIAMMGFVIPKFNQYLTNKALKKREEKKKKELEKFVSFDEFQNSTKKNANNIAFKGGIPKNLSELTYSVENNSRFRLLVTDIPMIIGRMVTSRNKYEALEFLVMDGLSAYFYNFASEHTQNFLRGKKLPATQAISIEALTNKPEALEAGLKKIKANPDIFKLQEGQKPDSILKNIFGNELASEIYKNETFGKYGKANRYIENDTIKGINDNIESFITHLFKQAEKQNTQLLTDGKINIDFINKTADTFKHKNARLLAIGLGVSIFGLSVLIPKLTFWITKKLTGRNEFIGIAKFDDDKKNKNDKKS